MKNWLKTVTLGFEKEFKRLSILNKLQKSWMKINDFTWNSSPCTDKKAPEVFNKNPNSEAYLKDLQTRESFQETFNAQKVVWEMELDKIVSINEQEH